MDMEKLICRNGLGPGSNVDTANITVQDETLVVDVSDLTDVTLHLVQIVDGGTVTLSVEYTLDGTYWAVLTTKADTDFADENGDVEVVNLANGSTVPMPIPAKKVRIRASALSAGGTYALRVGGRQMQGQG